MNRQIGSRGLNSWIVPEITWSVAPDVFVIVIEKNDRDIVRFISKGWFDVGFNGTKKGAAATIVLAGWDNSLHGELLKAVWEPARLMPNDWMMRLDTDIPAYFVSAFLLPDAEHLAVVVSRSGPRSDNRFPLVCKAMADQLLAAHENEIANFNEKMRLERERVYSKPEMEPYKDSAEYRLATEEAAQRPILAPTELLPLLPKGIVLEVGVSAPEKLGRLAVKAIAKAGVPLPRDGSYFGVVPAVSRGKALGVLSWTPHIGPPSFPEIKAALQIRLPPAFASPRKTDFGRPKFDTSIEVELGATIVAESPADVLQALNDLRIEPPDVEERVEGLRGDLAQRGFEAIAWYQAYHVWSEQTWGIYVDAVKLDDLACSILQDLRQSYGFVPHHIAAFLALGLTLTHEMFHGRVEVAASWLEVTALQPRYVRYSEHVYEVLRETPEWLEEALANWSAWTWFKSTDVQKLLPRHDPLDRHLELLVKDLLDLAPPGYKDWRSGDIAATWRLLGTQIASGKSGLQRGMIALPVESILKGPFPYDFKCTDIPLRFVGTGLIADRLLDRAATLNVPARSELERALRYYKHLPDISGGKGSHEKWTGPDKHAFILPKRDPVSIGVFKSFLRHVGIDKSTYLASVRPNL